MGIADDETRIESTEGAISALDDIASFLDGASRKMAKAGIAEDDSATVLAAESIGIAFCRVCDVLFYLKAEHGASPETFLASARSSVNAKFWSKRATDLRHLAASLASALS